MMLLPTFVMVNTHHAIIYCHIDTAIAGIVIDPELKVVLALQASVEVALVVSSFISSIVS